MTEATKRTGALCVGAAALVLTSESLRLAVGLLSRGDSAASLMHTLTYGLALAGMYALLLALTAVYVRSRQALGVLGLVGYVTASLGTVLVAGDWWFEAFTVPMIGAQAPALLDQPPGGTVLAGALITTALFAAGWFLFGVAAFRSRAFSRPAAALLVVGGACAVLALSTPYQVPLAIGVGWTGCALLAASRRESSSATRAARPVSEGRQRPAGSVTAVTPSWRRYAEPSGAGSHAPRGIADPISEAGPTHLQPRDPH